MIKIEAIASGKAAITRHGKPMPIYLGMLMTYEEVETLVLSPGCSVTYSVDELEVITKVEPEKAQPPIQSTKKVVVPDKLKKLNAKNG